MDTPIWHLTRAARVYVFDAGGANTLDEMRTLLLRHSDDHGKPSYYSQSED